MDDDYDQPHQRLKATSVRRIPNAALIINGHHNATDLVIIIERSDASNELAAHIARALAEHRVAHVSAKWPGSIDLDREAREFSAELWRHAPRCRRLERLRRWLPPLPDPHAGRRWLKQDHAPDFAVKARPWRPPAPPSSPAARPAWPATLRAFRRF